MRWPLRSRRRAIHFLAAVRQRLARPSPQPPPLLADLDPAFAAELAALLAARGQPVLSRSVPGLSVVELCHCNDPRCASFYTVARFAANWRWQQGGETLDLDARTGTVRVDIAGEQIISVEVLDRPQLASALKAALEHNPCLHGDDRLHRNT